MQKLPSQAFPAWRATSIEGDFVHLKLCDGRTFSMFRWEARQVCRELLIAFNIVQAVTDTGEDIFKKDSWLIKTRKNINNQPECCPKEEQE